MSKVPTLVILQGMADALPTHPKGDDTSDLASSYEAIGLAVHAYLVAMGFRFIGFDESKHIAEAESLAPRLPPQWNNGFGSLSFAYKHKASSMEFVCRIDRMGPRVSIRGLAVGHDQIEGFEVAPKYVVDSKSLPLRITLTDNGEDRSDLLEKVRKVFTSDWALSNMINDVQTNIISKLFPSLLVNDNPEQQEARERLNEERRRAGVPHPSNPPPRYEIQPEGPSLLPQMARPRPPVPVGDFPPPGFEDEHQMNRPPPSQIFPPGQHPFNIGHDDLNPPGLGPRDPLVPSLSGSRFFPRPGGSSGMHPTFDDPLFTGQGSASPGGEGYDPQIPPGARYDPVGPGGDPRFPGFRRRDNNDPSGGSGGFGAFGGGGGFGGYGQGSGGFGPGSGGII